MFNHIISLFKKKPKSDSYLNEYGETELTEVTRLFDECVKMLIVLSENADRQKELIGYGAVAEEIAEDFNNFCYRQADRYWRFGFITEGQYQTIYFIDSFFDNRSGADKNPAFWDDERLGINPEWDILRDKASELLIQLNKAHFTISIDREIRPFIGEDGKERYTEKTQWNLVNKVNPTPDSIKVIEE
jgi:hypothetical protein